jgi:ParB-like chromosome segregation protein Spo0J
MEFLMVDVVSVHSNIPRSNFNEADLDILADSILECGGILKPLVLKKIGFEKYELLDGHFEYYAAVRAREKNPDEGEMVNAFIIPAEKQQAVLKQIAKPSVEMRLERIERHLGL